MKKKNKGKPAPTKITYTTPASVLLIIEAKGDGTGINNTENGVYVDGVLYPKGTVFCDLDGKVFKDG